MATTPIRHRFNRTMALAIAAGITITGTQAVAPAADNNSLIGPAVAEAQTTASDGTRTPPTIDEYVYYDTTIEGKTKFDKNNPRIYTLRQARALAKTQSTIQGYLLNLTNDAIWHGDIEMYTVNADTNERVQKAPSFSMEVVPDGTHTAPHQNDLQSNSRRDLQMAIYPVPGTWGAAIKVNNYSAEYHDNVRTESVTSAYYRVVDVRLGYEGKNIAPGQSATLKLLNSGNDAIPKGTTFELDNDFNNYEGWNVSVNRNTGDVTVKLDKDAPVGTNLLIPVVANYPNGTPETITAIASSSYSSEPGIREVRNNNGVYTIVRTDGTKVNVKIDTTGDVTDVTVDKNGDLEITYDNGQKKTVSLKKSTTKVTETGRGTPDHQITIDDGNGNKVTFNAYDNYVTKINPVGEGKFELVMRNGNKIQGSINLPESNGVVGGEVNDKGDLILVFEDGSKSKPIDLKHTNVVETGKNTPNHQITITTPEGKKVTFNAYDNYVESVEDNGKGVYTLILKDGTRVKSSIDTSKTIKSIENRPDGSIVLVRTDGTKSDPIKLEQTTITEKNKGKPNHTITITSPNGDTVTFNAFDVYVTDVKKNDKGDYDIYRSDIGGGKKVWKTIVLSDLRDDLKQLNTRVEKLEEDSERHEKEITKLKEQIERLDGEIKRIDGELGDLRDRMDDAEKRLDIIEGDIRTIKGDISKLDARVTDLEARVTDLETSRDAWAKCYSGISMLAMPLALATPLYALSQAHLPGVEAMNTQIQKQLGVYNEQLARMWSQHGDILGVASAVVGIAATIGAIAHISNECRNYNETAAVQDTKVGELSSKRYARLDARATKREIAQETNTVSAK
mgnify:CR=1 FL=1